MKQGLVLSSQGWGKVPQLLLRWNFITKKFLKIGTWLLLRRNFPIPDPRPVMAAFSLPGPICCRVLEEQIFCVLRERARLAD